MCKVMCDAKTCKNYKEGVCQAETITIKNFEWWNEDEKEYKDHERCFRYEYDNDWMCRPKAM
jgi:hypothetical protein